MQSLIAYSIVAVAIAYVGWLFLPVAGRRWLHARVVALLPVSHRDRFARLQPGSQSVGCSTCKGCAADTPTAKPMPMHRR